MWRALVSLAALGLIACSEKSASSEVTSGANDSADTVKVFESVVERRELVEPIVGTGTIGAARTTDIGPSVEGIIEEIFVHVGDRVVQGQPLFKTRDIDFRLRHEELSYQLKLAEAENENAQSQLRRVQDLKKKGVVSAGKYDEAQAAAQISAARLGIAEAQLAAASQALTDTLVLAPYDGVITRRDVNEGRFMSVRGFSMPGESGGVIQLMQIDNVYAVIQIAEVNLPRMAVGTKAKVTIDGVDASFDTEILVLNDMVDPASRSVEVRLEIENADYAVKPGLFARAEIYPTPRSALVIGRQAVLGFSGARYVFVNDNGIARRRPVVVEDLDADLFEISSGLEEGEAVLSGPGIRRIDEGTPITIQSHSELLDVSQVGIGRG